MLDILLFREDRGNDPERIRESQRRRFASVELVDEVIKLDKEWRQRQFEVDNIRKEVNKVQDAIKKKKMAKEDTTELLKEKSRLEDEKAAKEKETADCKTAVEASLRLVGNLVHDSVPIDNNEVHYHPFASSRTELAITSYKHYYKMPRPFRVFSSISGLLFHL